MDGQIKQLQEKLTKRCDTVLMRVSLIIKNTFNIKKKLIMNFDLYSIMKNAQIIEN